MVAEHTSWLLPTLSTAYKHRKDIASGWEKFEAWLLGEKSTVAFTGAAGVGKTVLLDHLSGDAFKSGYRPPDESQKEEKASLSEKRKRIRLVTIPGQVSGPRYEAFRKIMSDKQTVDGIIHVVANGFRSVRDETAKEILSRDFNTLAEFREAQVKVELEDLRNTCEFIRQSHQRHHRPKWLIVAVAKIDLYYRELDEARVYYSPLGRSEFTSTLNGLRDKIGHDFFRWDAAPVCAWPENFLWNRDMVKSELHTAERDHYLGTFAQKLQAFC